MLFDPSEHMHITSQEWSQDLVIECAHKIFDFLCSGRSANGLWNDVLHFSAVNPEIIFGRFKQLGFGQFNGIRWYDVPTEAIAELPAVVYRAPKMPRADLSIGIETIEPFNAHK
jgi:hypothetical protein